MGQCARPSPRGRLPSRLWLQIEHGPAALKIERHRDLIVNDEPVDVDLLERIDREDACKIHRPNPFDLFVDSTSNGGLVAFAVLFATVAGENPRGDRSTERAQEYGECGAWLDHETQGLGDVPQWPRGFPRAKRLAAGGIQA